MTANEIQKQTLQTGHVGLNVSNLERSKKFYQEVFGFQVILESQTEGREFVLLGDGRTLVLTLWQQSEGQFEKRRPGLHHLSFQVDTIDTVQEFERRLRALNINFIYDGIVPHAEGMQSGGIFFEDPDGIRLEIYSPTGADKHDAPIPGAPSCGFF
jgi:catechol-2,3-dioxygenase